MTGTLDGAAIRALNTWCGVRALSWWAAHPAGSCPALVLHSRDPLGPWQRIMLVLGSTELRIENELGEVLASASSLPALLDAVDGGVTEPPLRGPALAGWLAAGVAGLMAVIV